MGYAGYVPAKLPQDLSVVQVLLKQARPPPPPPSPVLLPARTRSSREELRKGASVRLHGRRIRCAFRVKRRAISRVVAAAPAKFDLARDVAAPTCPRGRGPRPTPPPPPAPAQISNGDALEILYRLTYNVIVQPGEAKFRKLRLSNAKINAAVVQTPGALEMMREMGWTLVEEGGEQWLTLPSASKVTMKEARWIQERQEQCAKSG